jgi:cell division protein DivIC
VAGFEISFTLRVRAPFILRRLVNPRRILVASYVALVAAFVVAAGAWFVETHAEYRQLKQTEAAAQHTLADAKRRLSEQQRVLERMKGDPGFVEKVIRQRLGYARPAEVIFRYED